MRGLFESDLGVCFKVLVNVLVGGRGRHGLHHTEAQPMGLVGLVVRVLPNDYYFDILDRRGLKGIKDQFLGGIDLDIWRSTFLPDSYCSLTNL